MVMVPKELCSMLLGTYLFIYTDHKNLTLANLNYCQILCWHSFMVEYGPTILYHPGKKNVIAITLLCLPLSEVLPIPESFWIYF